VAGHSDSDVRGAYCTLTDDDAIRASWIPGRSLEELARQLGRPRAILVLARQLGLHRPPRRRRWDVVEDSTVRDGYSDGLTCEEIAQRLSGRTPTAVAARARKLGLTTYGRRCTADEERLLSRTLAQHSVADAARLLGRTPEAIRRKARTLGIATSASPGGARAGARWTADDDALVRLHAALNPLCGSSAAPPSYEPPRLSDRDVVGRRQRADALPTAWSLRPRTETMMPWTTPSARA
jgi:hypothetical protein